MTTASTTRYTVRTARIWAVAHLGATIAPWHGLPLHGPAPALPAVDSPYVR